MFAEPDALSFFPLSYSLPRGLGSPSMADTRLPSERPPARARAKVPAPAAGHRATGAAVRGSGPRDPGVPPDAAITLAFVPPGPDFAISADARMPSITVAATPAAPPDGPLQFVWTITLGSASAGCAHARDRVTHHPDIVVTTDSGRLTIPFTHVRGGRLSVAVAVDVAGHRLTAVRSNLRIVGTNPTLADLAARLTAAPDAFKRLMRLESGLRQFRAPDCPLWSADDLGGVGLCQLTPPGSDDQIWDWTANVDGGLALYRAKERTARSHAATVQGGAAFRAQVGALNARRAAAGLAALVVRVPDYTAAQLELDTIRAFNGYAGGLHEFRLRTDADNTLFVTRDATGSAVAEWVRVTAAERVAHYETVGVAAGHRGDPNYVDDVLARASF